MKELTLYNEWLKNAKDYDYLIDELKSIENDTDAISDRFYKELEFGTGGLRGVIGAGTNRMNVFTVAKATQGFADFINSKYKNPSVAIAYDSRIKSDVFSKTTASVFAANGIKVYIYKEVMPTPMLSFAVRCLKCNGGVVITASHNPSKYNGYKAYDPNGCQLDIDDSKKVIDFVNRIPIFNGAKTISFEDGLKSGIIEYIGDDVIEAYLNAVKNESINDVCKKANLNVIYTPLNGAGNMPVRAILNKIGVENVTVVKEQELPDGNFPTTPYPNPEVREAFTLALQLAKTVKPDLLLATDPDCDRVGIAVKSGDDYTLLTGNQVGILLLNYILKERKKNGTCPNAPIAVKTIVTTSLVEKLAKDYGCEIYNVLTGFKFIGGIIAELEKVNEADRYVLGFEESYGYLSGSYVRDKDAVNAAMLICEMASFYKLEGKTLLDVLEELYKTYGYYYNTQDSIYLEGISGFKRMSEIMLSLKEQPPKTIAGFNVVTLKDYSKGIITDIETNEKTSTGLPFSDVVEFRLDNSSSVIVRPSGTEPKIKIYIEAVSDTSENAIKH